MDPDKRDTVQVTVRIPPDLRRRLRQVCFNRDTSVQAEVESLIVRYVEHHEAKGVKG